MGGALATWALSASLLGAGQTALLDFSATWCGPCRQMEPVVRQLEEAGFPVQRIDIDQQPDLAKRFRIEGVPTFVLVVDGQEVDRLVGAASYAELTQLVTRGTTTAEGARDQLADAAHSVVPAVKTAASALGAATVGAIRGLAPWRGGGGEQPEAAPAWPAATTDLPLEQSIQPLPPAQLAALPAGGAPASTAIPAAAPAAAAPASGAPAPLPTDLVQVAARLKVDDATGHSFGTGTVIHSTASEAWVLTCGHIFRDSQGQGHISVDLFGPDAPQGLPGEVVSFDLKRDIGLVRIRPGRPVTSARVAPPGYKLSAGDPVVTIGCDNGADPTALASQITAVDKYLGPPNVEVAGQPVQGRSGGGLFSADGQVIGVCNAADPQDNEGLFAALGAIHEQLSEAGLAQLANPGGFPVAGSQLTAAPPAMPDRMPLLASQLAAAEAPTAVTDPAAASIVPTSASIVPASAAPEGLSLEEQAAIDAIQSAAGGAEVICVIRSLDNPRAKSEIIVLDRASPGFLRQLAAERQVQDARYLTSGHRPLPSTAGTRPVASPGHPASAVRRPAPVAARPAPVGSPRANWQR